MAIFQIQSDPAVERIFETYPNFVREQMEHLRQLVFETAASLEGLGCLEETLKWGEPSYVTKHGSTIRMDWKGKAPRQYALYFSCSSKLVSTFRECFPETFQYEGNRAIVFQLEEALDIEVLKRCLGAALRYHKVKHLPNLGL